MINDVLRCFQLSFSYDFAKRNSQSKPGFSPFTHLYTNTTHPTTAAAQHLMTTHQLLPRLPTHQSTHLKHLQSQPTPRPQMQKVLKSPIQQWIINSGSLLTLNSFISNF